MEALNLPPLIYTIGDRSKYIKGMVEARNQNMFLLKLGQEMAGHKGLSQYYYGGIVFQSPRDARRYIDNEWPEKTRAEIAIFEVTASWEHDCYFSDKGVYWKYLHFNRPITRLVEG